MSWQEVAWPELGCDHRQVRDRAGFRRGWGGAREKEPVRFLAWAAGWLAVAGGAAGMEGEDVTS